MAKRFRDSKKWRGWYRTLPPKIKLLFDYMCDECDHAGIFKEDYDHATYCIGEPVSREDVEEHLSAKVLRLDVDKLFIPSFLEFQYDVNTKLGTDNKLNPNNKAHLGVIRELKRNGVDPSPYLPPGSPLAAPPLLHPSPSKAPSKDLPRSLGEEEGIGNGKGEGERGKGGAGEKPKAGLVLQVVDGVCAFCGNGGTVYTRDKGDQRDVKFRCSCPLGVRAPSHYEPWSPLHLTDFEVLKFEGWSA